MSEQDRLNDVLSLFDDVFGSKNDPMNERLNNVIFNVVHMDVSKLKDMDFIELFKFRTLCYKILISYLNKEIKTFDDCIINILAKYIAVHDKNNEQEFFFKALPLVDWKKVLYIAYGHKYRRSIYVVIKHFLNTDPTKVRRIIKTIVLIYRKRLMTLNLIKRINDRNLKINLLNRLFPGVGIFLKNDKISIERFIDGMIEYYPWESWGSKTIEYLADSVSNLYEMIPNIGEIRKIKRYKNLLWTMSLIKYIKNKDNFSIKDLKTVSKNFDIDEYVEYMRNLKERTRIDVYPDVERAFYYIVHMVLKYIEKNPITNDVIAVIYKLVPKKNFYFFDKIYTIYLKELQHFNIKIQNKIFLTNVLNYLMEKFYNNYYPEHHNSTIEESVRVPKNIEKKLKNVIRLVQ